MDFQQIVDRILVIRKTMSEAEHFFETADGNLTDQQRSVEQTQQAMTGRFADAWAAYLNAQFGDLKSSLRSLYQQACLGSSETFDELLRKITIKDAVMQLSSRELLDKLYASIEKLNGIAAELNSFDFNRLSAPRQISTVKPGDVSFTIVQNGRRQVIEAQSPRPTFEMPQAERDPDIQALARRIREHACYVYKLAQCVETKAYEILTGNPADQDIVQQYRAYLADRAQEWLQEVGRDMLSQKRKYIQNEFSQSHTARDREFLSSLLAGQKDALCDFRALSADYQTTITPFCTRLSVFPSAQGFASDSEYLHTYFPDGCITAPVTMDLLRQGNVMITLNSGATAYDFEELLHRIICSYYVSFPTGRLTMCAVDPDDLGDFSRYVRLKKINPDLLYNGIIRDARDIDDTVRDLEKDMHRIFDEKINYNDCSNLFDYNRIASASPQNAHLFVLVNFPSMIRPETASRIMKIIANGNRAGIYTILVNQPDQATDYGFKDDAYRSFLQNAAKKMTMIQQEKDGSFSVQCGIPNRIELDDGLFDSSMVQRIVTNMAENAEKAPSTAIPLSQMFIRPDGKHDPLGASRMLHIPIGMRGGELQYLDLDTQGKGSPYAVIIGSPGFGKSNLLHAIVLSACYQYSPRELQLYLVDFKGGVGFKYYEANKVREKQLPHIRLTGLTSNPEDGVAILQNLRLELEHREALLRRNNCEDIIEYNALHIDRILPRLLIVIDEVQELFERDQRLGDRAIEILGQLLKKGRALGIGVIWASQNVPNVIGIKDKVINQIGNRICLRLNNVAEAEAIGISQNTAKGLNRPETGLAIMRTADAAEAEFRVAFAEKGAARDSYTQEIIQRWQQETVQANLPALFIVGDDEQPNPIAADSLYAVTAAGEFPRPAAMTEPFQIGIGQNYITGLPYTVPLEQFASKSNMVLSGADIGTLRDMLGYAMLSTLISYRRMDGPFRSGAQLYYANAEIISPADPRDLYYVLPQLFPEIIQDVSGKAALIKAVKALYLLKTERSDNIRQSVPVFLFVNKLQAYGDLFSSTERFSLQDDAPVAPGAGDGANPDDIMALLRGASAGVKSAPGAAKQMTFLDMFREVFSSGPDFGIHMVLSTDNIKGIPEIERMLTVCANRIYLKGVPAQYTDGKAITDPALAYCYHGEADMDKCKPYRYSSETDEAWLGKVVSAMQRG